MNRITRPLIALALALTAGCGAAPQQPPAAPLAASPQQLAQIPALQPGPHAVRRIDAPQWPTGASRLRLVEPVGEGPFPLIVFSHGFASDVDQYDAVLSHWASHGYVALVPFHADGGGTLRAIAMSVIKGKAELIAGRVADVRRILDHLDELDALSPGLAARTDRSRIAIAGHSFGAFTAQQFGGAVAIDPDDGERIGGRDPRVRAVVALSPPGEMFGLINARSWQDMDAPMLATTGTWDVDGRFVTDWRQHGLSFDTARPGDNWLLVVEGADHYLGNLICRTDRETAPQSDALRMVNATTTAFLDMQLRDDARAAGFIRDAAIGPLSGDFARLSHR